MAGLCQGCGRAGELHTCRVCAAKVCSSCLRDFGCPLCRGGVQFGKGFR